MHIHHYSLLCESTALFVFLSIFLKIIDQLARKKARGIYTHALTNKLSSNLKAIGHIFILT